MDMQLLICDLDGTLTDGGYYVSDDFLVKKIFCRDYQGLLHLNDAGIPWIIVSRSSASINPWCFKEFKDFNDNPLTPTAFANFAR